MTTSYPRPLGLAPVSKAGLVILLVAGIGVGQTLYVLSSFSPASLSTVNPVNGAMNSLGILFPSGLESAGLAFDGVDLYTIRTTSGQLPTREIYRIDINVVVNNNMLTTPVALTSLGPVSDLAWDPFTQLFFATESSSDRLLSVALNGTTTLIGSTPAALQLATMAIDGSGNLWAIDTLTGELGRLSKTTAGFTSVAFVTFTDPPGFSGVFPLVDVGGMAFDPSSGVLYAVTLFSSSTVGGDTLYTINTSTGVATRIGWLSGSGAGPLLRLGLAWTKPFPEFSKVMLTELSWGDSDGVEIGNFSNAVMDLTGWSIKWRDSTSNLISSPLNTMIAPGELIIVKEAGGTIGELPTGTQVLSVLPTIFTGSSAITAALVNGVGTVVDEVRVSDNIGGHPGWTFGGLFRGLAVRGTVAGSTGAVGVERIWGLDSDGGRDWTEQPNRSFGLENRNSGSRGTDPIPLPLVKINETDDNLDYVELRNIGTTAVNLTGWFFLMSAGQGTAHTRISPFPAATTLPAGGFIVIGDTAAAPTELAAGVPYVDLSAVSGGNIPWVNDEYDCALYDVQGRLVDLMRTTGHDDIVVHNHPRAPSSPFDFAGAAGRNNNGGDDAIGRGGTGDTDTGADFRPVFARTMGFANSGFGAGPGHGDLLDVRINETSAGQGLAIIWNAGQAAGGRYSFLFSVGHYQGTGPVFGLGPDAINNWLVVLQTPPFTGILDAQGSARIDIPPGVIAPGLDLDCLFLVQAPSGPLLAHTLICEFDT